MTLHHLCFSGSSACSGVNPCVACAEVTGERVLPAATIAGGLNGSLLALVHLFAQALYQVEQRYRCGVDPANLALSKLGIPLSSVPGTPEDQARAFHAAYREAWGRLVQGLTSDPTLSSRVVRTPVFDGEQSTVDGERSAAPMPLTEEQLRELMRMTSAQEAPAPPDASSTPAAPPPPAPPPAAPPTAEGYEAFLRKRGEAVVQPTVGGTNTTPMDAEDIAAAAVALDPSALPNGSIHS